LSGRARRSLQARSTGDDVQRVAQSHYERSPRSPDARIATRRTASACGTEATRRHRARESRGRPSSPLPLHGRAMYRKSRPMNPALVRTWQVNQPLFDGRGRWKNLTGDELRYVIAEEEELLEALGYPTDDLVSTAGSGPAGS